MIHYPKVIDQLLSLLLIGSDSIEGMSRCFPYPPPGYKGARTYYEALIESIKRQKEEEKVRQKKKKEKKREKKEKEKAKKDNKVEDRNHNHKRRRTDDKWQEATNGRDPHHGTKREKEQLENSSLTVEFGHPVAVQNLNDSTDSTLNNNKRQKCRVLSDGKHNSEGIIRIRLPLQRHKDPEVLPHRTGQPSLDVQQLAEKSVQGKCEVDPGPVLNIRDQLCSSNMASLSSRSCELVVERCVSSCSLDVNDNSLSEMHSRMLTNWIPPPLELNVHDNDDQDWLFETNNEQKSRSQSSEPCGLSSSNSNTWSHACYLPETDMYVLPFTVLF